VRAGEGLWAVGELTEFGRLMRESGSSSVNNYEVRTPIAIKQKNEF
jgi:galactokinase